MSTPRPTSTRVLSRGRFPVGSTLLLVLGAVLLVTGLINYGSVRSHCSHDHGLVVNTPVSSRAPFGYQCIEKGLH